MNFQEFHVRLFVTWRGWSYEQKSNHWAVLKTSPRILCWMCFKKYFVCVKLMRKDILSHPANEAFYLLSEVRSQKNTLEQTLSLDLLQKLCCVQFASKSMWLNVVSITSWTFSSVVCLNTVSCLHVEVAADTSTFYTRILTLGDDTFLNWKFWLLSQNGNCFSCKITSLFLSHQANNH